MKLLLTLAIGLVIMLGCHSYSSKESIQSFFDNMVKETNNNKGILGDSYSEDFVIVLSATGETVTKPQLNAKNKKKPRKAAITLTACIVKEIVINEDDTIKVDILHQYSGQESNAAQYTLKKINGKYKIIKMKINNK